MYFMVNTTFINYLSSLDNLTDSLKVSAFTKHNYIQTDFTYFFASNYFSFYSINNTKDATILSSTDMTEKGKFLFARKAYQYGIIIA